MKEVPDENLRDFERLENERCKKIAFARGVKLDGPYPPDKPVEERKADVLRAFNEHLSLIPGFPQNPKHLATICGCVAEFVRTTLYRNWNDRCPDENDLGDVVPLDWLVQEILHSFEKFPSILGIRRIYNEKFRSLDGRELWELEARNDD